MNQQESLWRIRGYKSWLGADSTLALAMSVNGFALPLIVLLSTGNAAWSGIVGGVGMAAVTVAKLPGGYVHDRFPLRAIVIIHAISGVVLFSLGAGLLLAGLFSGPVAIGFAILLGLRSGLGSGATNVLLRSVVPTPDLPRAMAVNQGRDATFEFVGPPVGGFLLDLHRVAPFTLNAILNLLAATCGFLMPRTEDSEESRAKPRGFRSMFEGFGYVVKYPFIRVVVFGGNLMFALFNGALLMAVFDLVSRGASAGTSGFINSATGVGVLVGSLISVKLIRRFQGGRIVLLAMGIMVVAVGLLSVVPTTWGRVIVFLPALVLLPPASAIFGSFEMVLVPQAYLGRFFAGRGLIETGIAAVMQVLTGIGFQSLGFSWMIPLYAAAMALCWAMMASTRDVRGIPKPDQYEHYAATMAGEPVA